MADEYAVELLSSQARGLEEQIAKMQSAMMDEIGRLYKLSCDLDRKKFELTSLNHSMLSLTSKKVGN